MAYIRKGTKVGTDNLGTDICVGDTVLDENDRRWTIDHQGRAVSGNAVKNLSELRDITVLNPPPCPVPEPQFDAAPPAHPDVELKEASGFKATEKPARTRKKELKPRNGGNHRTNLTGVVTFCNLARSLKKKSYELHRIAEEGGFEIVCGDNPKNRNAGIRVEDEERFRAILQTELQEQKPAGWSEEDEKMIDDIIISLTKIAEAEDNILPEILPSIARKYVERLKSLRPSWKPSEEQSTTDTVAPSLEDFSDKELIGELTKRGSLPAIATDKQVVTKEIAFSLLTDQDLADELRRRGFQLNAFKHIEL